MLAPLIGTIDDLGGFWCADDLTPARTHLLLGCRYMPYLMRRFLRQGGRVAVDNVSSFSDRRFADGNEWMFWMCANA